MLVKFAHPDSELVARCEQFSADQGYNGYEVYETIAKTLDARPIIDNRNLWRQEKQDGNYDPEQLILRLLNGGAWVDNVLYSERGTVYCQCPAKVHGFNCEGLNLCLQYANCQATHYDRVVRIDLEEQNPRNVTPTPHHTRKWDHAYRLRSAVERVFSRVAGGYLLDRHFIRGITKMKAKIGLSMVIVRLRVNQQNQGITE